MLIEQDTVNLYQDQGVVLVKKIISSNWIKKLKAGIKKNFENPSQYKCVYEKKMIRSFFMMTTVIGNALKNTKIFFIILGLLKLHCN